MRYKTCHYCDTLLSASNTENDHLPIPCANGGRRTVPCCIGCHDLKDRFNLDEWPAAMWVEIENSWHSLPRATRIFIAKLARLFHQHEDCERCKKVGVKGMASTKKTRAAKGVEMPEGGGSIRSLVEDKRRALEPAPDSHELA